MKRVLKFADEYVKECSWKEISLLKLCLCSLGVMLGLNVSKKYKKPAFIAAWCVFCVTYVPLMVKLIDLLVKKAGGCRALFCKKKAEEAESEAAEEALSETEEASEETSGCEAEAEKPGADGEEAD